MSLNHPAQPPSQFSNQPDLSRPIPSRLSDRYIRGEDIETSEPVSSPHGAADETGNPATEVHDGTEQHPLFQPFFTLIEDAHTGDYYHPTVHYIFSDDDTDIITEAALRSLEAQQDALSNSKKDQPEEQENPDPEKSTLLPPPMPGVRENYVVLDIDPLIVTDHASSTPNAIGTLPDNVRSLATSPAHQTQIQNVPLQSPGVGPGNPALSTQTQFRVTSAKSFSPTWQVLRSEMVPAPTFDNHDPSETPGHGLMLKIHGTSGLPYSLDMEKDKGERGAQRLEEMMDQFAKRMQELQMVIDGANVNMDGGEEGHPVEEQEQEQELEHGQVVTQTEDDGVGQAPPEERAIGQEAMNEGE